MNQKELRALSQNQPTADQQFKTNIDYIKRAMKALNQEVKNLEKEQKNNQKNWGFTGSAGKVAEDLQETLGFLGRHIDFLKTEGN